MSRRRSSERSRGVVLSGVADVSFFGAAPGFVSFRRSHMAEGAARGESRGGYWEGEPSENLNPRGGSGMKQGQENKGGVTRQEAEKA